MGWIKRLQRPKETLRMFIGWCLLGAGFHHALHFVTHLFSAASDG